MLILVFDNSASKPNSLSDDCRQTSNTSKKMLNARTDPIDQEIRNLTVFILNYLYLANTLALPPNIRCL